MKKLAILTNGIIKENPSLILVLGMCPTLAVTSSVANGFGMGISTTAVLICSNTVISMIRNVVPRKVRIPCFIVVIAGFVTIVQLLLQAYLPDLYSSLGLFIPLIVVNCIVLGRAEMFASKNKVFDSMLDGIGMGLGFTFTLVLMGTMRELLAQGTWLGYQVIPESVPGIGLMSLAPGGFIALAVLMAIVRYITTNRRSIREQFGEGDETDLKTSAENFDMEKEE